MKEFTVNENVVNTGEMKKLLSHAGSSNCEAVCFTMERYCESVDLTQCSCSIKTKNSAGKSDVVLPQLQNSDDKIEVLWTVSSASTSVAGKLLVQIQFEKIFDDNTKNIVWQSNVMEFEIAESLASADEVYDQNPTLFQQWEEKVSSAASSAAKSEEAAKASSEAAAASAQTAQQQAEAAKSSAEQAQQKVDTFSGYYKQEINNGFANALIGEAAGQSITLNDVQPYTNFRSLLVSGQTTETGSGDKSPGNPYVLSGTAKVIISDGAAQSQEANAPQTLYGLSGGICDTYDAVSGAGTKKVGKTVLSGTENWSHISTLTSCATFGVTIPDLKPGSTSNAVSDRFIGLFGNSDAELFNVSSLSSTFVVRLLKSRMSGWADSWTSAQKIAAFKAWLAANPVTVIYPIITPAAIAGTAQTIAAYAPKTSVTVENGTCSVKYCRDINAMYQELISRISSL